MNVARSVASRCARSVARRVTDVSGGSSSPGHTTANGTASSLTIEEGDTLTIDAVITRDPAPWGANVVEYQLQFFETGENEWSNVDFPQASSEFDLGPAELSDIGRHRIVVIDTVTSREYPLSAVTIGVDPLLVLDLDYRLSSPNVRGPLPVRVSTDFDAVRGILIDDADGVPLLGGVDFAAIYNQTQGTFFVEFERAASDASAWALYASDGTTSNRIEMYVDSANVRRGRMAVGGTLIGNINGGAFSAGPHKMAIAYDSTSLLFAVNGTVYTDATIGAVPSIDQLRIGDAVGGGFVLGDYLKTFRYYNIKQTSGWLVTETTIA